MAGQQFKTTEEEMRALSNRISQVSSSLKGEITRLNGVVDGITSGWQGGAAQAYDRLQRQVNQDGDRLSQILNDIKEAVDTTTRNYSTSEEEQRSAISQIASQSPFG